MTKILLPEKEFFSIGEVSQITQLPAYVLRYWESEFKLLRPARRTSGHRKYTKKDIEAVLHIKELLYSKNYTIAGARKFILGEKRNRTEQLNFETSGNTVDLELLKEIRSDLEELADKLK